MSKKIFVIGGTGAQGIPVVEGEKSTLKELLARNADSQKELTKDGAYSVRVLTRDPSNQRAQDLAKLKGVELLQGRLDSDDDLRNDFKGCWGAWVNMDGFVIGKKNELFWGMRSYQLAQEAGLRFFVWANLD